MKTSVLVSQGYPVRVADTLQDLFKGSYPKAISIVKKESGTQLDLSAPITDRILNIIVTYAATEVFEEQVSEYTIHTVTKA